MRSTQFAISRSVALAAAVGLSLLTAVACADAPLGPQSGPEQRSASSASTDSITLLREGSVYRLVVQHPCTGGGPATALDAWQGFGGPPTGLLINVDRGPKCGCPETIPPPTQLKGYVCTLTTWDCGTWGSSCNYQCTKPVIVYV
jgi:hypothetical protein